LFHFINIKQSKNPTALDFRNILNSAQILNINVIKQLTNSPQDLSLSLKSQLYAVFYFKSINESLCYKFKKIYLNRKECQTVFASASCLNASFLDNERHYNTSSRYPGLDLSKAKDIHNLLSSLNNEYLNELVRLHSLNRILLL
jgi:hypothetical protein